MSTLEAEVAEHATTNAANTPPNASYNAAVLSSLPPHSESAPTVRSEAEQRQILAKMRRIATGLLVLMTMLFLVSRWIIATYPETEIWMGFVRSFAEAAMVGGIADWFAVTALFRHPFGIPIPHTAIVPNKKDAIGRSLGNFIQNNFLTQEALEEKLKSMELLKTAEEWLANPENSAKVARQISSFIPSILNALDDEQVKDFIENNLAANVQPRDLALAAGNLLGLLTANNKHQDLFNELIKIAERILEENKTGIRQKIREESPWFVPDFVRNRVYAKVMSQTEEAFWEITNDPNHPLRKRFLAATEQFIHNLKTSPEYHERIAQLKNEMLENPVVQQYLQRVWTDLKNYILSNLADHDSQLQKQIQAGIYTFFNNLIRDETMRNRITHWVYTSLIDVVSRNRHEIGNLISNTIQKWDRQTLTNKLELYVGKDLQYIRINGTLVGGTVGLAIHAFAVLLESL
jgi:uncharacterized membrane-anchored protein YjiN (DUF445 family)